MDHVILTRFNLPTIGEESIIRAKEGWLTKRWALFTEYCLPSVRNQTTSDFKWIVYLDPESPHWLLDEMNNLESDGVLRAILRESVSPEELREDINAVTKRSEGVLATTNLDNDDALAPDFAERIQTVHHARPCAVYLVNGLIRTPDRVYRHTDKVNAFCTVIDQGSAPKTCWLDWHNLLPLHMPSVELSGQPGWLQVVHGSNVSNRVHGHLIDPTSVAPRFPGMLDDVRSPSRSRILSERIVIAPGRRAREFSRAHAKKLLITLGGKSGLERVRMVRGRMRPLFRNNGPGGGR